MTGKTGLVVFTTTLVSWSCFILGRMIPTCPCKDPRVEHEFYGGNNAGIISNPLVLCVVGTTPKTKAFLEHLITSEAESLSFRLDFSDEKKTSTCTALLKIVNDEPHSLPRHLCPGKCRAIPEVDLSEKWFDDADNALATQFATSDNALTCTLSGRMISFPSPTASVYSKVAAVLNAVFWRRLMECYERKLWYGAYLKLYSHSSHSDDKVTRQPPIKHDCGSDAKSCYVLSRNVSSDALLHEGNSSTVRSHLNVDERFLSLMKKNQMSIPRRRIRALVIWVGSKERLWLTAEQARVLSAQPFSGKDGVIGWAATDEAYPCSLSTITCPLHRGEPAKYRTLPQSAINFMPKGWGCAQRRPLRALAHTLWLVDPHFVITLDDDTFLNYDLLMRRYGQYLTSPTSLMATRSLIMGELGGKWGDLGHMTKWGMFAGGGGYILSRKAVEALMSYEVKYYPDEEWTSRPREMRYNDQWRSSLQVYYLSVYREGIEYSREACTYVLKNGSEVSREFAWGTESRKVLGSSCVFTGKPVDKRLWRQRVRELLDLPSSHPYAEPSTHATIRDAHAPSGRRSLMQDQSQQEPQTRSAEKKFGRKHQHHANKLAAGVVPLVGPIAVPLIDFCANLMASERTCQHSDHSLGRCLIYGAFADPVSAGCKTTIPFEQAVHLPDPFYPEDPSLVKLGMCFMAPVCNISQQITCHRYKPVFRKGPNGEDVLVKPERMSDDRGHYKVFSSSFNGTFIDSHM